MAEIRGVTGNQKNIRYLSEALQRGRISHAYIIEGPEDSGKEQFADSLAAALLCAQTKPGQMLLSETSPCGRCPSCIKAASGNHPDIIHVQHEKATVLSVREIREQVVADIAIKPYYGPFKIYIIRDAQLMNESGQNALLKTIEEPEEYGIIFLLTDNADGFLPTIRSRCIRLSMDPLPRKVTAEHLLDEAGRSIVQILENDRDMDALRISKAAKELEGYDRQQVLTLMRFWFRDMMVYKSTRDVQRLYFPDDPQLREMAEAASYEHLDRILGALEETQDRLNANVKAEAAYETLLLTIRRNSR